MMYVYVGCEIGRYECISELTPLQKSEDLDIINKMAELLNVVDDYNDWIDFTEEMITQNKLTLIECEYFYDNYIPFSEVDILKMNDITIYEVSDVIQLFPKK